MWGDSGGVHLQASKKALTRNAISQHVDLGLPSLWRSLLISHTSVQSWSLLNSLSPSRARQGLDHSHQMLQPLWAHYGFKWWLPLSSDTWEMTMGCWIQWLLEIIPNTWIGFHRILVPRESIVMENLAVSHSILVYSAEGVRGSGSCSRT